MSRSDWQIRNKKLLAVALSLALTLLGDGPSNRGRQLFEQIRDYLYYRVAATHPLMLLRRMILAAIRLRLPSEWKLYICQKRVLRHALADNFDSQELWSAIQAESRAREFALLGAAGSPAAMAVVRCGISAGLNIDELARLFRAGLLWIDPTKHKLLAWQHRPRLLAWTVGLFMGGWLLALGLVMLLKQHADINFVLSFIIGGVACAAWVGHQTFKFIQQEQNLLNKVVDAYQPRIVTEE